MKKYYFIFLSLLLILTSCSKNTVIWHFEDLDEAIKLANNKIIMIDFYTDW